MQDIRLSSFIGRGEQFRVAGRAADLSRLLERAAQLSLALCPSFQTEWGKGENGHEVDQSTPIDSLWRLAPSAGPAACFLRVIKGGRT
jgi:hypothetical protein